MANVDTTGGAIEPYRQQISLLQNDPNATPEYRKQLDSWLTELEGAIARASGAPNHDAATPQPTDGEQPTTGEFQGEATEYPEDSDYYQADASSPIEGDSPISEDILPENLRQWLPQVREASATTGVPEDVLLAVLWAESSGNGDAASTNPENGGADIGLMQINSTGTFPELQRRYPELQGGDLTDPETNILAGAYYLAEQKEQFGSWDLALRAYNSGPGAVDVNDADVTLTGQGDPDYVTKVNERLQQIRAGESQEA